MSFSQGDVVLVPFPFTDLSATKQRPALVLSPERLNKIRPDLVLAAITSQVSAALDHRTAAPGWVVPSSASSQPSIASRTFGEATLENVRQKLVEFVR